MPLPPPHSLAKKVHRDAIVSMKIYWGNMLHHEVKYDMLCGAIRRMDKAIKKVRAGSWMGM